MDVGDENNINNNNSSDDDGSGFDIENHLENVHVDYYTTNYKIWSIIPSDYTCNWHVDNRRVTQFFGM